MGGYKEELTYEDVPQDYIDYDHPGEVTFLHAASMGRVTIVKDIPIANAPKTKVGKRTSLCLFLTDTGETQIYPILRASELTNLPWNAIPMNVLINQVRQESESLARELEEYLREHAAKHTAHHTAGVDNEPRKKLTFALNQLLGQKWQDPNVAQGIIVPEVNHRALKPKQAVGPDGVGWD